MRLWEFPLKIQKYNSENQQWSSVEFASKADFIAYMKEQFKLPGEYNLRNVENFQIEGLKYSARAKESGKPNFEGGYYTKATKGSHQWKKYWQNEKDKVLYGVIIDDWYLPPFYYWYLNFCPIFDALLGRKRLPDVWDSDLWYFHYCMMAILLGKHIGGVKGRQKGYSYKHMAILYWSYCWFENSVNTIGGYMEDLVKKSWRFLEGYRKHLNSSFSAWKRGPTQPKSLEWNEVTIGQDNNPYGLQSKLVGVTFKQSPSNDVGGSQTFFNYEEPGVSPTLLETLEFVRPALERGTETTGTIIACGSVGDLDDAEGLKSIFYNPEDYNFLGIKNIWDNNVTPDNDTCCIFVSEAYNMDGLDDITGQPFMDENGNSNVQLALAWIARNEEKIRKSSKKAELKQLQLSQKCISPEQAFAQRKLSEFPIDLLKKQQERIKLKDQTNSWEYKPQKGLFEEVAGRIVLGKDMGPEHQYPINPEWEDKRGCWTIYEAPDENSEFFTYYACVDAIEVDQTETSASIASVDIFKTAIEVTYKDKNGKIQKRIEGDKLVATYRGRYDTARKTNEQIWLGIKLFNAFVYPERNKPNFINYMREMGRAEKYLAKESDVPMFKDLNIKNGATANNSKYGFHKGDNTEIWKFFKAYTKEYFHTEYGRSTFEKNGNEEVLKVFTGIDRIDDYWLLEEFIRYVEVKGKIKGNYDRLVSFMGALFIAKIYQQNRMIKRRNDIVETVAPQQVIKKSINMLGGGMKVPSNRRPGKPYSML